MGTYRDDREALRQRNRSLEDELSAAEEELSQHESELSQQQAELIRLRKQVAELEGTKPVHQPKTSKGSTKPSAKPPAANRNALRLVAVGVLAAATFSVYLELKPKYCQARVYISDPRIARADFVVTGPDGFEERCTGKVCDFKLKPGRYTVRAQAGDRQGEEILEARPSYSLSKPIQLK